MIILLVVYMWIKNLTLGFHNSKMRTFDLMDSPPIVGSIMYGCANITTTLTSKFGFVVG